jgi:hypothetical protein
MKSIADGFVYIENRWFLIKVKLDVLPKTSKIFIVNMVLVIIISSNFRNYIGILPNRLFYIPDSLF